MILRIILTLALAVGPLLIKSHGADTDDMRSAMEWCDRTALRNVEGVWEFPEDMTRVLICRDLMTPYRYDIILIDSPDTRIVPGDKIGYLAESPSSTTFEMGIYRTKLNEKFARLGKCVARFDDKEDALLVSGKKIRLGIGSRWLLPSFWKLLRVSLDDPAESLPRGLVRVYPEPTHIQPDYL